MAYHEVVHGETRRGAQHTVGMAVLIYCLAAVFGMLHFRQKYVPIRDVQGLIPRNASDREILWACPAGHFCARSLGNQSRFVDCARPLGNQSRFGNQSRPVPFRQPAPCYLWISEVNAYAFRTPVLPCLLPLLPAALALLCQCLGGNGAGEIMLRNRPSYDEALVAESAGSGCGNALRRLGTRPLAYKAMQRAAAYVVFMVMFHVCYAVKSGLERAFLGDFDASDTVAAFMLATTIAWREYAHLCKSRGTDCATGVVFAVCVAQLVSSMYLIYQTCQYFHRPWESIGGMLEGGILCYFFFYVTTADCGLFGGFAGTRDAPFNSPGLCNMPRRREPLISKGDDMRELGHVEEEGPPEEEAPEAGPQEDGSAQEP